MPARKNAANPLIWRPEDCLDALHRWVKEHGRAPAATSDWGRSDYTHPAARTCERQFGSWRAFIEAGGYTVRRAGSPCGYDRAESVVLADGRLVYWTKDRIVEWMLDFLFREKRWPTVPELRRTSSTRRPNYCTVIRAFGSLSAAKVAAGWSSSCEACGKHMPNVRASQRFCSRPCRRAGTAPLETAGCAGCGADMDVYTLGCKVCMDRRHGRERRKDPAYIERERLRAQRRRASKHVAACRVAAVEPSPTKTGSRRGSDSQTRRAA